MNEVVLRKWRPGLETIKLILLVRKHAQTSLKQAKELVERFVCGDSITLSLPTRASKADFLVAVEALGVEAE